MDLDKPIPELTVEDLSRMYLDGEECDKRIFSEMRTNLQLVAGDHYVREGSRYWNKIRDSKQLSSDQRLKLTKNHTQRVTKYYRNAIESYAPDVWITAANEKELQSQKQAELNQSYWDYIKRCNEMSRQVAGWIKDFVEVGEVCTLIRWDMNGGQIIGYEPMMAPNPLNPDEMVPVPDGNGGFVQDPNKPQFGGKIKYETFEAYNLRRDPAARSMSESPYLMLSKLISKKALRAYVKGKQGEKELLDNTPTNEFTVYDNNTGYYRVQKDQLLIKECYWRPSPQCPNGYFQIFIDTKIIEQGELPYGIFPIVWEGFDEQTGNPRAHSVIRHVRPAQIEINRCASKIAEHQITMGDSKVWVSSTTKVSQGAMLPGVRVNTYSGMKPEFQQGEVGSQYFEYLNSQIDELYRLAMLDEVVAEQPETQDLYVNLLKSFRFRRKFAIYGEKFERFLCKVAEVSLSLAKASASEQELVPAFGRSEYINMAEFKSSEDIHYQIKIKPRSDDVETQFGKQITLNHLIQYVGPNMEKDDLGMLIRNAPFLNQEKMMEKFTQKYDNLVNDILALDRGIPRPPRKYDDHKYIIAGISSRMGKSDFEFLPDPVKFLYEEKISAHEQLQAEALMEIQRAQAGFIPSGGYLVGCDFYEGDPENPTKTKRVRIPSEAINWLIDTLRKQGTELMALADQPVGVQEDLARMMTNNQMLSGVENNLPGDPFNAVRNAAT